jgi:hypothetical protein
LIHVPQLAAYFFSDSRQDCACLEITSDNPSLTTLIFKTNGLADGADYINQVARQHADTQIQNFKETAPADVQRVMATESFERALEAWWYDFEVRCKRDLDLSQSNALLDKIILVPVPDLLGEVKKASHELARRTKQLIHDMILVIEQTTARMPTVRTNLPESEKTSSNTINASRLSVWVATANLRSFGLFCSICSCRPDSRRVIPSKYSASKRHRLTSYTCKAETM